MPGVTKIITLRHTTQLSQNVAHVVGPAIQHIAAAVQAKTGAPPAAVKVALSKVLTLHLTPPGSDAQQQAVADIVSFATPGAQAVAGAANAAAMASPAFWVAYYTNVAETKPLPAAHPWAGIIAQALLQALG